MELHNRQLVVDSSPAVADGMVFVGSYDDKVYALDESTGARIWSYTTGDDVSSSPAVADGMVFIGSGDYRVYAFGVIPPPVVMPLDIQVDVGSIRFRGEIAEFYVLTSLKGSATDSTITKAMLYHSNGTANTDLSASITRIATGLYRIPYTIPADAPEGTYTLVIEANYITSEIEARGVSFKSFNLSPTLTGWNAWLVEIKDGLATIQTDTTTIQADLTAMNATITSIDGNVATIETDIGTIQTDVSTIDTESLPSIADTQTSQGTTLYVNIVLSALAAAGALGALALILRKRKQT